MREILFRGKRIDNGEWVVGQYVNTCYPGNGKETGHFIVVYPNEYHEIYTSTLCQFTGLCDKNGNKIWENDIIKYHFGENYAPIKYGCYQNCFDSQKTEHVGFYVDWSDGKCLRKDLGYWINMVDTMPVGNIFDNPELLQEESNE